MNKKYMDFVPVKAAKPKKAVVRPVAVKVAAAHREAPKPVSSAVKTSTVGAKSQSAKPAKVEPEKRPVIKNPFVNTEKVSKRPLSKNVYQKKVEEPKEKVTGPVTIINKPEKESRVGLVVTIIITIILGAAAGVVAFLLLPK